ncbi:hypothetical protein CJ203_10615 [Corynebacterium tuscaniense]|uniref:Uncharacterized protein n=1 Tax=Corynebacterium tuscaniense TaxID=302449 RepID=A0A2N6T2L9_9CORY|nr:hypothetical protein [Corynebacterium tuscaniense]PMC63534.1 hypothetical protein CJ203_10615 [Corynebacterium tuscaniense]
MSATPRVVLGKATASQTVECLPNNLAVQKPLDKCFWRIVLRISIPDCRLSGATRSAGGFELQSHLWQLAPLSVPSIELGATVKPAGLIAIKPTRLPLGRVVANGFSREAYRPNGMGIVASILADETEAVAILQHVELQRGFLVVIERNQFNILRQINP